MVENVDEIVRKLTKAGQRALRKMKPGLWVEEGAPGPRKVDVYPLWWGKDRKFKLVEQPKIVSIGVAGPTWAWMPSKLGLAVRARLNSLEGEG